MPRQEACHGPFVTGGGEEVEFGGVGGEAAVGLIPWFLQKQGKALRVGRGLLYNRFCSKLFLGTIQ
jgi:hypothetical protein